MSRIDKALRTWEKKDGVSRLSERFEIGKYEREHGTEAIPPELPVPVSASRPSAGPVAATHPGPTAAPAPLHAVRPTVFSARLAPGLDPRLVTSGSGAVPVEQYRRLAAVLHDIQKQQGLKSLMLTSALPAEGKTISTINLALTLSESYGRRVLIVDADLRWPSVHRVLGISNEKGLSESLTAGAEPAIRQVSPSLFVLTAGNPDAVPLAGLTSNRMGELIDAFSAEFDWVLIDTPPVGLLPDAQLLARLTRAVVFVISAGVTPQTTVERALAELGSDCVIGAVLNRVEDRRIPESGYYSRYGYGYSDENDK
jgi:capsular exopolysaccharide synthesis family protein